MANDDDESTNNRVTFLVWVATGVAIIACFIASLAVGRTAVMQGQIDALHKAALDNIGKDIEHVQSDVDILKIIKHYHPTTGKPKQPAKIVQ